MKRKNDLVNAHVLCECMDPEHGDCEKLRDAIIDNFYEVKEAEIVTQITEGEANYCVTCIATISRKKKDKFKKAIETLKIPGLKKGARRPRIRNVRVYLETT